MNIKELKKCQICGEPLLIEYEGIQRKCACGCFIKEEEITKIRQKAKALREYIIAPYRENTFDKDDKREPEISLRVTKYVEVFNTEVMRKKRLGIFFYGQPGSGKTFFAMCIANALIDKGILVKHTTMSRIVNMQIEEAEKLLNCELLIIDDLGTERKTETAQERAFEFVDKLSANIIPLIITSNYEYDSLVKQTQQGNVPDNYIRIYDRLLERCVPIKVNKLARRKENLNKNLDEFEKIIGGNNDNFSGSNSR